LMTMRSSSGLMETATVDLFLEELRNLRVSSLQRRVPDVA
jgi:hypothetical protein